MCTTTFIRYWGYFGHLISKETVDKFCDKARCVRDYDSKDPLLHRECGTCEEARKKGEEEKPKALFAGS
jgi:hypothetical protein